MNTKAARISIGVGHGPSMGSIVQPAGPLIKDKCESKFRPIVYKDYIRAQQSTVKRGNGARSLNASSIEPNNFYSNNVFILRNLLKSVNNT